MGVQVEEPGEVDNFDSYYETKDAKPLEALRRVYWTMAPLLALTKSVRAIVVRYSCDSSDSPTLLLRTVGGATQNIFTTIRNENTKS